MVPVVSSGPTKGGLGGFQADYRVDPDIATHPVLILDSTLVERRVVLDLREGVVEMVQQLLPLLVLR